MKCPWTLWVVMLVQALSLVACSRLEGELCSDHVLGGGVVSGAWELGGSWLRLVPCGLPRAAGRAHVSGCWLVGLPYASGVSPFPHSFQRLVTLWRPWLSRQDAVHELFLVD